MRGGQADQRDPGHARGERQRVRVAHQDEGPGRHLTGQRVRLLGRDRLGRVREESAHPIGQAQHPTRGIIHNGLGDPAVSHGGG